VQPVLPGGERRGGVREAPRRARLPPPQGDRRQRRAHPPQVPLTLPSTPLVTHDVIHLLRTCFLSICRDAAKRARRGASPARHASGTTPPSSPSLLPPASSPRTQTSTAGALRRRRARTARSPPRRPPRRHCRPPSTGSATRLRPRPAAKISTTRARGIPPRGTSTRAGGRPRLYDAMKAGCRSRPDA
jgi:hypothetical protein